MNNCPIPRNKILWSYLKRRLVNSAEAAPALIELAWSSVAALTVAPLQDVLDLGVGSRMNIPGRVGRKLALALHRGDVVDNRFAMAARIDGEVEASCEPGVKRSAAEGGKPHICASEVLIKFEQAMRVLRAVRNWFRARRI